MKNHELIGIWETTNYVFDNGPDRRCVVGSVRLLNGQRVVLRGYAAEDELHEGMTFRFYGHPKTHPKYGPQFQFASFVEEQPVDEDSLICYLMQCRKPERGSLTRRVAVALFEKFGSAVIEKLIADPVVAADGIARWEAGKAAIAAEYLSRQVGTQRCKLSLIRLFDGRGFPKRTLDRAVKEWGARAAEIISADPYVLTRLPGIGFKGADKLYCDLARETSATDEEYTEKLAAIHRQGLCAAYGVSSECRKSGSTWMPIGQAMAFVIQNIGRVRASPDAAIRWAELEGKLTTRDGHVSSLRMALHELEIAECVTSQCAGNEWPDIELIRAMEPEGKPLSDHQLSGIEIAKTSRIGCLQGSPGVGKTFSVACIVKAVIEIFGMDSIATAAPTGKAAVRMTQSLAANGLTMQATTIHRLLQVEGEGGDGWSFHYNDQNPLPYRFLVIDESSMVDVDLMASLVRACTPMTHVLLIGDSNQLAPVGHGRPFFDLQSCVPTGHLTEILRNSGQIVKACAEIRDQNKISFSPSLSLPEDNLILIQVDDSDQVQAMENVIRKLDHNAIDVVEDVQILTGKNDGSEVARKPLNAHLQKMLNPDGEQVKGNPFRVGDKIVCLKNGTYPDSEDQHEQHFVANGELGRVASLQPGRMVIRLADPPRSVVICHAPVQESESGISDSEDAQRGAVGDWDLGYCLSVHRSQGSQWKFAIVMADSKGAMVQSRNWLYTAISRAEVGTIVIGQRQVVNAMLRRDGISGRKTFLVERCQQQRIARVVDFDELFAEV